MLWCDFGVHFVVIRGTRWDELLTISPGNYPSIQENLGLNIPMLVQLSSI